MANPTVLERLDALLESRRYDPESDAILDALLGAIADAAERLGVVAFGTDAVPPGRALSDPSVAPSWALAHAAQYTGAILPGRSAGETEDEWLARARDAAVYPAGLKRATEEAVRRAAAPYLTGTRSVFVSYTSDPYAVVVRTITSETPDPAAVQAVLEGSYVSGGQRGAIGAHQVLIYETSDDPAFSEATLTFDAVADGVTALNVTLGDVT